MSETSERATRPMRSRPARVALLIALLATGLGCSLPPPLSVGPTAGPRSYDRASGRPSFYDRYREEQHRHKVEKELRDIKRNTQRK
jgi:hypothetical protein